MEKKEVSFCAVFATLLMFAVLLMCVDVTKSPCIAAFGQVSNLLRDQSFRNLLGGQSFRNGLFTLAQLQPVLRCAGT